MERSSFYIERLGKPNLPWFRQLNAMFTRNFEDEETYAQNPPSDVYLLGLLDKEHIIPLVALSDDQVIGGLVAYELEKFEQERREIYIYDLAVDEDFRRQGVATALIEETQKIASKRNAWVVYVQADYEDPPAVALYAKLGTKEEVLHFDIEPFSSPPTPNTE